MSSGDLLGLDDDVDGVPVPVPVPDPGLLPLPVLVVVGVVCGVWRSTRSITGARPSSRTVVAVAVVMTLPSS